MTTKQAAETLLAAMTDGETEYFGRIIEIVRRGAALPPAAGDHAHTLAGAAGGNRRTGRDGTV